ncbi:MAG: alpha-amylase family glycosyl hydrolase [Polyangiales bacterium]
MRALLLSLALAYGCTASPTPGPGLVDVPLAELPASDAGAFDAGAFDAAVPDAPAASDVARADASSPEDVTRSDAGDLRCPTAFRVPAFTGRAVSRVEVTGEWSGWSNPGAALQRGSDGAWTGTVSIPPGLHGYKLLVDGGWELDPAARRRKYVGGVENSGVLVADCALPTLTLVTGAATRGAPGAGEYAATVAFAPGAGGGALDPASVRVTLRRGAAERALSEVTPDPATGRISLQANGLDDGKYTARVEARDREGRAAAPLKLVFWVEAEAFTWQGATIYMAMVDRFVNGSTSNDPAPTAGVDPRADFQGGDFQGLRARIADGTLDRLGVRALWIAPVNRNPDGPFLASNGRNQVMGYHGYWPTRGREVDPRFGGEEGLHALIAEAHAHGIRVLQDFVVNHVHRDHEYFRAHPEWFRTGCVCGTNNCDWTARRLDCLFTDYLPDVNWSVPEAAAQFVDDAAFWIDRFDLDGLRVDAVKHVEDIVAYNLRARLHDEFEATGQRVFLTGETAMGWSDCGLDCNRGEYDTISRYIGPNALDGQADFVLYHAVPYRAFSSDARGMLHVDYWTQQSAQQYPAGSVMTPYVGSHDTARFTTLASYRGQSPGLDPSIPGRQWDDVAEAPRDASAYARHRLAMTWVLTIPGAPLVYYGDEYGEWGGADPNNRRLWRAEAALNADERATLAHVRAAGSARRELVALRVGEYASVAATEETLLFARRAPSSAALVALSRADAPRTVTARLPGGLFTDGTVLRDRLGGASVTVTGGAVSVSLGPWGSAILAP